MNLFKLGGYFFMIVGGGLLLFNFPDILEYMSDEQAVWDDYYPSFVACGIGSVQSLMGFAFVKFSKYFVDDKLNNDGYEKLKMKLESKIVYLESKGNDASRYKTLLNQLIEKRKQNEYDKYRK